MTEEIWAEIEGYPDYAVSSHGRVKSLRYNNILGDRINSYGLHRVTLYRDREAKDFYVHHLVAQAFITGYIPGLRVMHRDENHSNNSVHNLRFREDQRMGTLIKNPTQPKERRIQVDQTGMIFRTVKDCADYIGGFPSSIYRVLRGERSSHLGYTFKYVEETSGA